jgi:hypothetical protein
VLPPFDAGSLCGDGCSLEVRVQGKGEGDVLSCTALDASCTGETGNDLRFFDGNCVRRASSVGPDSVQYHKDFALGRSRLI